MKNRISPLSSVANHSNHDQPTAHPELFGPPPKPLVATQIPLSDYLSEHPLISLGAAVCIGMALGWFMKRR
jgi:hypothetical protein